MIVYTFEISMLLVVVDKNMVFDLHMNFNVYISSKH